MNCPHCGTPIAPTTFASRGLVCVDCEHKLHPQHPPINWNEVLLNLALVTSMYDKENT